MGITNPKSLDDILFRLAAAGLLIIKSGTRASAGSVDVTAFTDHPATAPMNRVAGDKIVVIAAMFVSSAQMRATIKPTGGSAVFDTQIGVGNGGVIPVFGIITAATDAAMESFSAGTVGVTYWTTLERHLFGR